MKIVIALTGMPGSGKTTVSTIFKEKGFKVLIMGDAVRKEMQEKKIEINNRSLRNYVLKIRKSDPNYVLNLVKKELNDLLKTEEVVVLDGSRNVSEIKELKKEAFKVVSVAVIADKAVRFDRIRSRNNSSDVSTLEEFEWREGKELKFGCGEVIASSDYFLINNSSVDELRKKIDSLILRVS